MSTTTTEETVKNFLAARGDLWPPTANEIAEDTDIPLSTVYVALKGIGAQRSKRGKNQFGYVLPDPSLIDFLSVERSLGMIGGRTWADTAQRALSTARDARFADHLTAENYADGFENFGQRFLELAAHARAVQDRPDWKIVLGLTPDTEKE